MRGVALVYLAGVTEWRCKPSHRRIRRRRRAAKDSLETVNRRCIMVSRELRARVGRTAGIQPSSGEHRETKSPRMNQQIAAA